MTIENIDGMDMAGFTASVSKDVRTKFNIKILQTEEHRSEITNQLLAYYVHCEGKIPLPPDYVPTPFSKDKGGLS